MRGLQDYKAPGKVMWYGILETKQHQVPQQRDDTTSDEQNVQGRAYFDGAGSGNAAGGTQRTGRCTAGAPDCQCHTHRG